MLNVSKTTAEDSELRKTVARVLKCWGLTLSGPGLSRCIRSSELTSKYATFVLDETETTTSPHSSQLTSSVNLHK